MRYLLLLAVLCFTGCERHHKSHYTVDYLPPALSIPVTISKNPDATNGITLTWSSISVAQSYQIYRCEVPDGVTQDLTNAIAFEDCGEPIAVSTTPNYTDVPPRTAPQAYVYHLRACVDVAATQCGDVIASIAAAQAAPAALPQMTSRIGDEGRQVISGLTTTLHAFSTNAEGDVQWRWTQEGGPKVSLLNADTPELTFTPPNVSENTLLSFELRTSDANGIGRPAKVAVTVVPANNVSVKAGAPSRIACSGDEVSLHARGSDDKLIYEWRQISPESPAVTLIDADTANPRFTVPEMPQGGVLHFEVIASDPVTGRNASARTSVAVQYAVPSPMPVLEPSQTPQQVPTPIPLAAPLLSPLQIAQPLQLPSAQQLVPVANPILVPPKIPPQALVLSAQPPEVATGGTDVQLSATATGGREPYQWQWVQTSGPTATLTDMTEAVAMVTLPAVESIQTLTFMATVTDADGATRTAQAEIQATLVPSASSGEIPTPITPVEPRLVIVNETVPIINPQLTDMNVVQLAGPKLQLTEQPDISGGQVMVTAPLLKEHSAYATVAVTGKNTKGQPEHYIVPILIIRPPSQLPANEVPPQVLPPQEIPKQDDPLVIVAGTSGVIAKEGDSRALGVVVQGGKGRASYQYQWSYLKQEGDPDIDYIGENTAKLTLTIPAVDRPWLLRFHVDVTDGAQTVSRDVLVQINDVADSFVVGAMTPMTVTSGDQVILNAPQPTGGVLFATSERYRYSISQISGLPDVILTPVGDAIANQARNWRFTAPTLPPGAADVVLQFEFTSYDRVDNQVKVTQDIIVKAPIGTPMVPNISVPSSIALGTSLRLQGDVTGGTPPYSYEWQIEPEVQMIAGKAALSLSTINEVGQNPSITPDNLGLRRLDVASYRLAIKLRVTDAQQQVAESTTETLVVLVEARRKGTQAMVCGDINTQTPCTDLDLVLGMTQECEDYQPYALSVVVKTHEQSSGSSNLSNFYEYRRCADASTAYNLFIVTGDKDNPQCRNYTPTSPTSDFTCHFACYGDGCNINTIPPDATLIGPVGSDGFLTIGQLPFNN
ncbi:PKD domain-containing protein [Shewanella acanthi]|uniref:PKD domain-containing protein n=1 Tax=Shewanella acanthi TaxID=2864212 RepID=UPI001C658159|nr:hypothetical protein [Shewanella acanthi]QYJ80388.1 hypothetical protein K0H61_08450 [Shewanella acanthi]